jgi:hypothetical protein
MAHLSKSRLLRRFGLLVVSLIGLQSGFCAAATDQTISEPTMLVVPFCRGNIPSYNAGVCRGTIEVLSELGPQLQLPNCVPDTAYFALRLNTVLEYIDKHPELREKRFVDSAQEALHDKWPCK